MAGVDLRRFLLEDGDEEAESGGRIRLFGFVWVKGRDKRGLMRREEVLLVKETRSFWSR